MPDDTQEKEPKPAAATPSPSGDWVTSIIVGFFTLIIFAASTHDKWPPSVTGFFQRYWHWFALGFILTLVLLGSFPPFRRWLKGTSVSTRVALTVFCLGLLIALVACVSLLPVRYQVMALRVVFLIPACLFPATLYYLFISTRKYGLLNEFIVNLDRLGLLRARALAPHCVRQDGGEESPSARRLRLRTYLQKFEAVYGSLPPDLVEKLLTDPDPRQVLADLKADSTSASLSSVFNQGSTAPLVLSTVLIVLGWLLLLPPVPDGKTTQIALWTSALNPEVMPVYFSFLGAYFFSIQMLFRRYIRRDLRGSAYAAITMRIFLAVIGTWVCMAAFRTTLEPYPLSVLAFAIGFFPPVAWQIVRAFVKKITFTPKLLPSLEQQLPLSDLDGLNIWHQSRLEEEDVESIPNMATADLVDLFLNTRIPPDRIIDWVDQSILYMHLPATDKGASRQALRQQGIRTASGLVYAYDRSACQGDRPALESILTNTARPPLRSLVMTLFTIPNLCLIQTWRGTNSTAEHLSALARQLPAEHLHLQEHAAMVMTAANGER